MKNLTKNSTSVKFERILTDKDGCKLIAFSIVSYFPKCKPQVSPCVFADFKDGLLRVFEGNSFTEYTTGSFKAALTFLKNKFK